MIKLNNILVSGLSVILSCAAAFPQDSPAQQPDRTHNSLSPTAVCAPPGVVAMSDASAQSSDCCIGPLNPGEVVAGSIPAPAASAGCLLGDTQYRIDFPGGARKLVIDLNMSQSAAVHIRHGSPVAIEGGRIQSDFFVSKFISSPRVERFSFPARGTVNLFDPGIPLLQQGSYFIAVANCGRDALSYTLSAMILDPPNEESIDLSQETVEVGSVPAPEPGACRIGRTQYFASTFFSFCNGISSAIVVVRADRNVNLYARNGRPVTEENGIVTYDFLTTSTGKLQRIPLGSDTPGRSTFFVAVENCGPDAINYTVTPLLLHGDPQPLFIERAFLKKKDLHIVGFGLRGVEVFIDDVLQQAIFGGRTENFRDIIIIKKAKKMIARQQTVRITVRSFSCTSEPLLFTRP